MPDDISLQAAAAPLTEVMRRLALDIAEAQTALDHYAERQASLAADLESPLPVLAHYFPEVELDLSLAFSASRFQGSVTLNVAPANPASSSFFRSASFSSRLRARIVPRAALLAQLEQGGEE